VVAGDLDALLELYIDLLELDDLLDLAVNLEAGRVELARLLPPLFFIATTSSLGRLLELNGLVGDALSGSLLEVVDDLRRQHEALVLVLERRLLRLRETQLV
jgi:hypothetical protein